MKRFFLWLNWLRKGKPMLQYPGQRCGCCGKYWPIPFEIRSYETLGHWDHWGLCPEGKGCRSEGYYI
jgi:hypothetical protein